MIRLTEQDINYIVKECVNRIMLNENQESDSQHKAIELAMQYGMSKDEAKELVLGALRNDMHSLSDKKGGKFTLGCTRMYLNGQIQDKSTINSLNQTIKLLASAHYDEYDKNLNGLSAQELIEKFKPEIMALIEKDKNELQSVDFQTNNNYKIVPINSFEEAHEYYKYFKGRSVNGTWCITKEEEHYDDYTCDGLNQIYFCLRNGFENEKPVVGEGCPLDDFGLSMISVIVNENGSLSDSTCRWNHENKANDSVLTTKQISEIVGVNFYDVFKPNHKWQDLIDNVKQRLANGEDPRDIFDGVGDFHDGYARVVLNGKENFINTEGNFLLKQWFDEIGGFYDGYARVKSNKKWNLIDTKGNILSKQWFDEAGGFVNGYAKVELNYKSNFIDTEGNILYGNPNDTNTWFKYANNFYDGCARIQLNDTYNFIDTKGNILYGNPNDTNTWLDEAGGFENGYAPVQLNNKWNFIDKKGNILSKQWFDEAGYWYDGYGAVALNGKWNYIDTEGNLYDENKNRIK